MRFMHSKRARTGAIGVVALAALASCTATAVEEGTEADAITAGEVANPDNPFYWAPVSFANFAEFQSIALSDFLDDTDPLSARLQRITDEIDATMRATPGLSSANIPRPVIKVLKSSSHMEAFSSGIFAKGAVRIGPTSETGSGRVVRALMPDAAGFTLHDGVSGQISSISAWNSGPFFLDAVQRKFPNCNAKFANGRTQLSKKCAVSPEFGTDELVLPATTQFVVVSTDLIAKVTSELSMRFVLAHELGHLYRAHSSSLTPSKYKFWYEVGFSQPRRPVPASDQVRLKAKYDYKPLVPDALWDVSAAVLPASLRTLPLTLAKITESSRFLNSHAGVADCQGYAKWAARPRAADDLFEALRAPSLPDDLVASYLELEQAVVNCTAPVKFTDNPAAGFASAEIGTGLFDLTSATIDGNRFDLLALRPKANETMKDFIVSATAASKDELARQMSIRESMRNNQVGLYTNEQEADEIAAEFLGRQGYSRDEILESVAAAWAALEVDSTLSESLALRAPEEAPAAICLKWARDGFTTTTASGAKAPILVRMGNLEEPHHSDCYRLYNTWREVRSHSYPAANKPTSDVKWTDIVGRAAELSEP